MKRIFKKITAIASGVLLAGMTVGTAAAANYPSPFVSGSTSDVAIVYGTGAGVDNSDQVQAGVIQEDLEASMTGSGDTTAASGGDSFKYEKSSTKFHLGMGVLDVRSSALSDDELETLLASEVFTDDSNNENDYEQKIEMNNISLSMFSDNDYEDSDPTIGLYLSSGSNVLNYTLSFTDEPIWTDVSSSELKLLGKEYYILSTTTNDTLTLLDSASSGVINEGETKTMEGKEVTLSYISESEVALNIDGEETNSLEETETQKLNDGSYVGIKDIRYDSRAGSVGSVEISLGSGKLKIVNDTNIEINDESISDLYGHIGAGTSGSDETLSSIKIQWDASEDTFITPSSDATMPAFKAVKLSFGGMYYPAEETISIENDGDESVVLENFPIEDGEVDINLLYLNQTNYNWTTLGSDADKQLVTSNSGSITFDGDTDEYFVLSWDDGIDAESYLMRATGFSEDLTAGKNYTDLEYYDGSGWQTAKDDRENGDSFTVGNAEISIGAIHKDDKTVVITATGNNDFKTLYSKEGLKVYLPWINETTLDTTEDDNATTRAKAADIEGSYLPGEIKQITVTNASSDSSTYWFPTDGVFNLTLSEEDKNGNSGEGNNVTIQISQDSDNDVKISDVVGESVSFKEIGDTDEYRSTLYGALATNINWDKSGDDDAPVTLTYTGDESYGEFYVTAPEVSVSSGSGNLGNVVIKDSEVNSMSDKNLVVVGGSCINTVAANLLGGSYCTAAFTEATGVGTGQFLIESFENPYDSSKVALLVAGYESADTVAGTTYLTTQTVDTAAGTKLKGTSATEAEVVVEE